MHTTMLCCTGVFSTATMVADPAGMAELPIAWRGVLEQAFLKAGSVHARATTCAPLRGPILVS